MSTPPPFAKAPPPAARSGNPIGAIVALLGLGVMAAGAFALPLSTYGRGGDYGYVNVRNDVAIINGRAPLGGHALYSGLATFWWRYGLLLAAGLLLVLLCALVAVPAARALGWVIVVLSVAAGVVHGLAMAQSADYRAATQLMRGYDASDIYTNAGAGVYVSLAGFGVLAVGGLLAALLPARR